MFSGKLIFLLVLTGILAHSTVVVVGFAGPGICSLPNFSPSYATTTMLWYVAEMNCNDDQYYRSRPHHVKVVDADVEKQEYVYIPLHQMEDAVNKAQENHEQDCANLQSIIDEQQEKLERLQEQNQKSNSADSLQCDDLAEKVDVDWGENHEAKMKRFTDRVHYLMDENQRLQTQLHTERDRFEVQKARLKQKLEAAIDDTAQANQMLGLERSYFETTIKLLEAGLQRETNNVESLEERLLQYNEMVHHIDYYKTFPDDLPPYETWGASDAYQQQQEHHHDDFHYNSHPNGDPFEEFQPQVRPQGVAPHYPQDSHIHFQHEAHFQNHEPKTSYIQHDDRPTKNYAFARSDLNSGTINPTKATTTVMGASSIRDNLGMNDIRDALYPP